MKMDVLKRLKISEVTVIASLPDMGMVGGLVSSYLAQYLKAEHVANIVSLEKPWVAYADGIVRKVLDIYKIYYDRVHNFLILAGESQPQDVSELYRLCNTLLDYAQGLGKVTRVYTAGGYLREQLTGAPRVCAAVNNAHLLKILKEFEIEVIGNEISNITWFNGLLLGLASERNIDSLGLFGEISETGIPQPLAAKSIVRAFAKIENIDLDTKSLDKQYESVLEDVQKHKDTSRYGQGTI